ncbi:hypothetical protein Y032_0143g2407 [Ancylostoma ceylanicum]|nr:hypothetical protein Y032_0143g2407 [Ancylostoma ceylanicum]
MPGYRSHGAKGAPAPSAAENTEIRDHQWRKVVLAGSSVKSAKDVGPSIQKRCLGPIIVETPRMRVHRWRKLAPSIVGKPWVRGVRRSSIAHKRPCHGFAEGVKSASAQQCGKRPDTVNKCCDKEREDITSASNLHDDI